jgi:hypothetical protein
MFKFLTDNNVLRNKNKELELEVESLKKELAASKDVIKSINDNISKGPFAFDFKKMNVFSIERNVNANKPCTIIGYILKEPKEDSDGSKDVVREWYFYCDDEQHNKLVEQFKAARK